LRLGAGEKNYDILRLMVSRYDMVLEILLSVFLGFSNHSALRGMFWTPGTPLGMNAEFVL
jgi:hypothetical protein